MDTDHNVDMMWKNIFNTGPYGKKQKLANFNLIIETMMSLYPYLINTHQRKAIQPKITFGGFSRWPPCDFEISAHVER